MPAREGGSVYELNKQTWHAWPFILPLFISSISSPQVQRWMGAIMQSKNRARAECRISTVVSMNICTYNIVKGRGRKGRLYYVEWIFKDKKNGFCSIKSVKGWESVKKWIKSPPLPALERIAAAKSSGLPPSESLFFCLYVSISDFLFERHELYCLPKASYHRLFNFSFSIHDSFSGTRLFFSS